MAICKLLLWILITLIIYRIQCMSDIRLCTFLTEMNSRTWRIIKRIVIRIVQVIWRSRLALLFRACVRISSRRFDFCWMLEFHIGFEYIFRWMVYVNAWRGLETTWWCFELRTVDLWGLLVGLLTSQDSIWRWCVWVVWLVFGQIWVCYCFGLVFVMDFGLLVVFRIRLLSIDYMVRFLNVWMVIHHYSILEFLENLTDFFIWL